MAIQRAPTHSIQSTNIADLLERVLDKGIVIAGDIRISLVDVELLTIQLRLVICSVDKAKEMGMDWWVNFECWDRAAVHRGESCDRFSRDLSEVRRGHWPYCGSRCSGVRQDSFVRA